MDMATLKSLLPVLILAVTGLVTLVKIKAKSDQTAHDLYSFIKSVTRDLDRLESDSHHTTRIRAQSDVHDKNISVLWQTQNDTTKLINETSKVLSDKLERHRDRADQAQTDMMGRVMALREKINGYPK